MKKVRSPAHKALANQRNKASPKRVFIWDLDDTLIWTSWAYSRAFAKFYEYMLQLFDYRLIELRTLGTVSEEIDKSLKEDMNPETGKKYGYSMYRFPASLVKTYEWLCEHGYGKYQEAVARRAKIIGMEAFDPLGYKQQGLVKGAEETLNYINKRRDIQILITKGEQLVQECKIVTVNLDQWFGDRIYIVDVKAKETFLQYREEYPNSQIFSIGNSYNSDIVPALEAGVRAIYIPYYTWLGEKPPPITDETQVLKIENIKQIIELYKKKLI